MGAGVTQGRVGTGRRVRGAARLAMALLGLALAGCATAPRDTVPERLARYQPRIPPDDRPSPVLAAAEPTVPVAPAPAEPMAPEAAPAPAGIEATGTVAAAAAPAAVESAPGEGNQGKRRPLRKADRLAVSLLGIPTPQEIRDVVDDNGNITLPLIGNVRVEGLPISKAEELIERLYIDGQFYTSINVIIVAQEEEYFVQGEVVRPGRYPLQGDLTLIQAIISAGGVTDYADKKRVRIIRGEEKKEYNTDKILDRREQDPVVRSDDVIVIPRSKW